MFICLILSNLYRRLNTTFHFALKSWNKEPKPYTNQWVPVCKDISTVSCCHDSRATLCKWRNRPISFYSCDSNRVDTIYVTIICTTIFCYHPSVSSSKNKNGAFSTTALEECKFCSSISSFFLWETRKQWVQLILNRCSHIPTFSRPVYFVDNNFQNIKKNCKTL